MKLIKIDIENFKSIQNITIPINECQDQTKTYGIIGENEAGKSSLLQAIALIDSMHLIKPNLNDFHSKQEQIKIILQYQPLKQDQEKIISAVKEINPDIKILNIEILTIRYQIDSTNPSNLKSWVNIVFNNGEIEFDLKDFPKLGTTIDQIRHKTVFWSFDEKYLISSEINLTNFFNSPEQVSIPLLNCFKLAGYKENNFNEISEILIDSTEREYLREKLSDSVTAHLRRVWKKHQVKITFDITSESLNFHVKDESSKSKSKTIQQRSDGFKQFISFLLTISAENINSDLKNTIILLDEPETHLHPKAQEDLLIEMIELTKRNNNIVFFATHSNYLIDKKYLERNMKITKNDDVTNIELFSHKLSTYASINYDVFGIDSTDYHNELYDQLREYYATQNDIEELGINRFDEEFFKQKNKLPKDQSNTKGETKITLPTFIRNCIHYPVNKPKNFDELLNKSIGILHLIKQNSLPPTTG